jgi:HD-GYP domain-containing protein (c-di-GMP phosphodiesterase class II)
MSREEAFAVITAGKGTRFDPLVVEAFEGAKEAFINAAPSRKAPSLTDLFLSATQPAGGGGI